MGDAAACASWSAGAAVAETASRWVVPFPRPAAGAVSDALLCPEEGGGVTRPCPAVVVAVRGALLTVLTADVTGLSVAVVRAVTSRTTPEPSATVEVEETLSATVCLAVASAGATVFSMGAVSVPAGAMLAVVWAALVGSTAPAIEPGVLAASVAPGAGIASAADEVTCAICALVPAPVGAGLAPAREATESTAPAPALAMVLASALGLSARRHSVASQLAPAHRRRSGTARGSGRLW